MTINGGKPHAVGDMGQRYEVIANVPGLGESQTIGYTTLLESARSMVDGVNEHPSWSNPRIKDRQTGEFVK